MEFLLYQCIPEVHLPANTPREEQVRIARLLQKSQRPTILGVDTLPKRSIQKPSIFSLAQGGFRLRLPASAEALANHHLEGTALREPRGRQYTIPDSGKAHLLWTGDGETRSLTAMLVPVSSRLRGKR